MGGYTLGVRCSMLSATWPAYQWEKEKELEEKRREDREHEIFMMQLLGQMLQKDSHHSRPDTQPFGDDF